MISQPSPSTIIASSVVWLAFAAITLLLRLITRVHFVKIFGAEDVFIVLALALSACHVTGIIYQVRYGLGTHISDRSPDDIEPYLLALFISILSYVTGHTLAKISILCLYIRVFGSTRLRRFLYVLLAFVAANGLWLILSGVFGCVPVRGFWDRTVPASCLPQKPMWFSNAVVNILTDFALVLSPMVVFRSMRLPKRQKLGLYVVFGLGFFVCITSVIRLPYLYFGAGSTDVTWNVAAVSMWSGIELNVAIICACLLVMKPLLTWAFGGLCMTGGDIGASGLDQGYESSRPIQLSSHGTSRDVTPQESA